MAIARGPGSAETVLRSWQVRDTISVTVRSTPPPPPRDEYGLWETTQPRAYDGCNMRVEIDTTYLMWDYSSCLGWQQSRYYARLRPGSCFVQLRWSPSEWCLNMSADWPAHGGDRASS